MTYVGSEWHCLLLCQAFSSHSNQQEVSHTDLFICYGNLIPWSIGSQYLCFISLQGLSPIMFHTMINRKWVTLFYFFTKYSHQYCVSLIPWPIGSQWLYFISLPGSLCLIWPTQEVCDIALFHCQGISSIISHAMTNSEWVILLCFISLNQTISSIMSHAVTNRQWVALFYFFEMQSCFTVPCPTGSKW